jgi:hypothetical protein
MQAVKRVRAIMQLNRHLQQTEDKNLSLYPLHKNRKDLLNSENFLRLTLLGQIARISVFNAGAYAIGIR